MTDGSNKECRIHKRAEGSNAVCPFYVKYTVDNWATSPPLGLTYGGQPGGSGCASSWANALLILQTQYVDGGYCGCKPKTPALGDIGFCTKQNVDDPRQPGKDLVGEGKCKPSWTSTADGRACEVDQFGCPLTACDGAEYDPWCMTEGQGGKGKGGKGDWCYCIPYKPKSGGGGGKGGGDGGKEGSRPPKDGNRVKDGYIGEDGNGDEDGDRGPTGKDGDRGKGGKNGAKDSAKDDTRAKGGNKAPKDADEYY